MKRTRFAKFRPQGFALGAFMLAAGFAEPGLFRWVLLGICALIAVAMLVRAYEAEGLRR